MTTPVSDGAIDPAIVQQAIAWLVRLQSGRADGRTSEACRLWRRADAEHERAWQRVQGIGAELRADASRLPGSVKGLAIDALATAARQQSRRRSLKLLSAALVLGPTAWLAHEHGSVSSLLADHRSALGERRAVTLADGSVVWLNSDTAIRLRFSADQRLIELVRGEIHIASGADSGAAKRRPLRVRSRHASFEALGTRFVVRQATTTTRLIVESGAVAMHPSHAATQGATRIADAGESFDVDREWAWPATPSHHDPTAWIDGLLVADDMPLSDFLAELSRNRGTRLSCDDAVVGLRLSGVYRLDDIDQLLLLLPQVLPVRVERRFGLWVRVMPRG